MSWYLYVLVFHLVNELAGEFIDNMKENDKTGLFRDRTVVMTGGTTIVKIGITDDPLQRGTTHMRDLSLYASSQMPDLLVCKELGAFARRTEKRILKHLREDDYMPAVADALCLAKCCSGRGDSGVITVKPMPYTEVVQLTESFGIGELMEIVNQHVDDAVAERNAVSARKSASSPVRLSSEQLLTKDKYLIDKQHQCTLLKMLPPDQQFAMIKQLLAS